jgi:DNA polymerase (family 10)
VNERLKNFEVARLFEEIARSLDVKGEQSHRPRAYRRAARALAACPEPIEQLAADARLREIPGIGPSLEALIREFLATGAIRTHLRLVTDHPPGLAPLLAARGFGPSLVASVHDALGVTTLDEVEEAARDGRLASAVGQKRTAALLDQLPSLRRPFRRLRLKSAWELATEVLALLGTESRYRVEVVGQARRMCEIVDGGLDLVADSPLAADHVVRLPSVDTVLERTSDSVRVRLYDGVELHLWIAAPSAWGTALVQHIGSPAHAERLIAMTAGALPSLPTEEAVYAALGLPWIPPDLREDAGEIEAALNGALPKLVQQSDLKGDLHCHTLWTDGSNTLDDMALAAKARGYAYMALTDHSRSLTITNGLSLERLEEARRCVQQLNHKLAPFVILLGTEMDILEDGTLDYPDEVLETLDYVSASVHSRFKQTLEPMTSRILRAVTHPLVHTLNHPHGRMLLARPAYAVDMPAVLAAAAASGCALEVSGDPARMDFDGTWARQARAAGARCTISSDAHSTLDFDNIWLGVASARRGWLEPADVLNTRPLDELRALLRTRGPRAAS